MRVLEFQKTAYGSHFTMIYLCNLSRYRARIPLAIIIGLVAAGLAYPALTFNQSGGPVCLAPRTTQAMKTYNSLSDVGLATGLCVFMVYPPCKVYLL